jgi:hypothetical protein
MQTPLQESASSTLKVKREGKGERDREKLKQLLKERKSVIGWINSSHLLLHLLFRFMLTLDDSITTTPIAHELPG